MPIEHKNITDPDIHEPKGIASANNLEMYIANGAGSGAWSSNMHTHHGEMNISGNTTGTSITAAVDATLSTDTDYTKITAGWATGHVQGITFNVDELVLPISGNYFVSFWCSAKIPLNNNFIGIKYAVNDTTPYSTQKVVTQSTTANDIRNLSASGLLTGITAGDTLSLYLAGTKTDSVIIQDAGLQLFLMHKV